MYPRGGTGSNRSPQYPTEVQQRFPWEPSSFSFGSPDDYTSSDEDGKGYSSLAHQSFNSGNGHSGASLTPTGSRNYLISSHRELPLQRQEESSRRTVHTTRQDARASPRKGGNIASGNSFSSALLRGPLTPTPSGVEDVDWRTASEVQTAAATERQGRFLHEKINSRNSTKGEPDSPRRRVRPNSYKQLTSVRTSLNELRSPESSAKRSPQSTQGSSSTQQSNNSPQRARRKKGEKPHTFSTEEDIVQQAARQVVRSWRRVCLWIVFCELSCPNVVHSSDIVTEFRCFLQVIVKVLNGKIPSSELSENIQSMSEVSSRQHKDTHTSTDYGGYNLVDAHWIVTTAANEMGLHDDSLALILGLLMTETNKVVKKRLMKNSEILGKRSKHDRESEADKWIAQSNILFQELDGWESGLLSVEDVNLLLLSQLIFHPAFRTQSDKHKEHSLRLMYGGFTLTKSSAFPKKYRDEPGRKLPTNPEAYMVSSFCLKRWLLDMGFSTQQLGQLSRSVKQLRETAICRGRNRDILYPWKQAAIDAAATCVREKETSQIETGLQDIVFHTVFTPAVVVFRDINSAPSRRKHSNLMGVIPDLVHSATRNFRYFTQTILEISHVLESKDWVLIEDWCTEVLTSILSSYPENTEGHPPERGIEKAGEEVTTEEPSDATITGNMLETGAIYRYSNQMSTNSVPNEPSRSTLYIESNDDDTMKEQISSASQKLATLCDALLLADESTRESLMQELRECRNSYFGAALSYIGGQRQIEGPTQQSRYASAVNTTNTNLTNGSSSSTPALYVDYQENFQSADQHPDSPHDFQRFQRPVPAAIVANPKGEPPLQAFSQRRSVPSLSEVTEHLEQKQSVRTSQNNRNHPGRQKKTPSSKPVRVPTAVARSRTTQPDAVESTKLDGRFAAPTVASKAKKSKKHNKAKGKKR